MEKTDQGRLVEFLEEMQSRFKKMAEIAKSELNPGCWDGYARDAGTIGWALRYLRKSQRLQGQEAQSKEAEWRKKVIAAAKVMREQDPTLSQDEAFVMARKMVTATVVAQKPMEGAR